MTLEALASGPPLDAVIIGGGINGCGIAAECARRGLRVALFEQDDFGFGTTWRSTKLIHGGLRYLEHGDVRLVRESLKERQWLLRTRPHLVRPQRFVLPMVPWTRRPGWQLRIGLAAYDLLAGDKTVPGHRKVSRERVRELVPFITDEERGGYTFYDARAIAPERIALELALEANAAGATVLNHARVTEIIVEQGEARGVRVEHQGIAAVAPARAVINAAGPWVDVVNRVAGSLQAELLGMTRGAHIVVDPGRELSRDGVFSTARSDGRVFFAVPQDGLLLIGTTDLRYDGDPSEVRPTAEEVDYLLAEAQTLLPGLDLRRESIRYAYAGLRPLQRVKGGPEAAISRRHEVIDHANTGGPAGLHSVIGGKLSTFRPLAREVAGKLGAPAAPESLRPVAADWKETLRESGLERQSRLHLRRYGSAIGEVLGLGREVMCPHTGAVEGEVRHAMRSELAVTLSDVLMRRTGIAWGACRGLCCHERAAALMASELGWDEAEAARQKNAFEADVTYHLPQADALLPTGYPSCTSETTSNP